MHERDTNKKTLPFGCWPSAMDAAAVASSNPRLAEPCIVGEHLYWLQSVPEEKGRTTIMCQSLEAAQNTPVSVLPRPLSAKSKVHEYGGGSYVIHNQYLYFVLGDDQQIYCANLENGVPFSPQCLTQNGPQTARYADLTWDAHNNSIIAVSEDHQDQHKEPKTTLVCIQPNDDIITVASGDDFYSSPVVSPCATYLVWLCWNHPDMPWDATEIWIATRNELGQFKKENAKKMVGTGSESLFLPRFHPSGELYFVSDKNNWWNLYKIPAQQLSQATPKCIEIFNTEAELATPQWVFRMSTYDFLDAQTILACCSRDGFWELLVIDISTSPATTRKVNNDANTLTSFSDIYANGTGIGVCIAACPALAPQLYTTANGSPLYARTQARETLAHHDIAIPKSVEFPTSNGEHAYAFFYAPQNSQYTDTTGKPPLIVICHGGPTGATDTACNPKIQYWTTRGFAVMDVNYRGSTGFGRTYRQALHQNWGIFDVADVCAAAQYAVAQGWADPEKLIIKGSSAGGYTVLAALAFTNTFKAGVSLYGIGDLETLVTDTHKFEARYLDTLIGQYPEQLEIYRQRSPIHHVNNINCPLLVFQGLQDRVVPPNQAQTMVDAVKAKGLYVDYITFEDEGHGFRNAVNIQVMLEREFEFYQKVFQL